MYVCVCVYLSTLRSSESVLTNDDLQDEEDRESSQSAEDTDDGDGGDDGDGDGVKIKPSKRKSVAKRSVRYHYDSIVCMYVHMAMCHVICMYVWILLAMCHVICTYGSYWLCHVICMYVWILLAMCHVICTYVRMDHVIYRRCWTIHCTLHLTGSCRPNSPSLLTSHKWET